MITGWRPEPSKVTETTTDDVSSQHTCQMVLERGYDLMSAVEEGAAVGEYLAMSPDLDSVSGEYFGSATGTRERSSPRQGGAVAVAEVERATYRAQGEPDD